MTVVDNRQHWAQSGSSIGSESIAMIRPTFVCGLMALAAVVAAPAEDFPLSFHTIPAKDVVVFPGGYGTMVQLRLAKPAGLKAEPKAVSNHPLYGECRETPTAPALVFRLDESKGDGKGYDQLIVDMNQNGDLTDDAPASFVACPGIGRCPRKRHSGNCLALSQLRLARPSLAGGRFTSRRCM